MIIDHNYAMQFDFRYSLILDEKYQKPVEDVENMQDDEKDKK